MKSLRIAIVLAMVTFTVGCQSGKFHNSLSATQAEPPFTEAELAAVENTVEQQITTPVSFTGRLQSSARETTSRNCTSRRG